MKILRRACFVSALCGVVLAVGCGKRQLQAPTRNEAEPEQPQKCLERPKYDGSETRIIDVPTNSWLDGSEICQTSVYGTNLCIIYNKGVVIRMTTNSKNGSVEQYFDKHQAEASLGDLVPLINHVLRLENYRWYAMTNYLERTAPVDQLEVGKGKVSRSTDK